MDQVSHLSLEIVRSQLVDATGVEPDPDVDRVFEVMGGIRTEKLTGASEVMMANRIAFAINQFA